MYKKISRNVQKILHKDVQVCFESYRRNMKIGNKSKAGGEDEHINKQGYRKISGNGGHGTDRKTADIFHCINSMWRSNCSSDIQTRGTYGKCIHCNSRGGTTCLKRILFISGNELYPDVKKKNVVCI